MFAAEGRVELGKKAQKDDKLLALRTRQMEKFAPDLRRIARRVVAESRRRSGSNSLREERMILTYRVLSELQFQIIREELQRGVE